MKVYSIHRRDSGSYLYHALREQLGREESQEAVQQVLPAFPQHVAMVMGQGEHGLYADLHLGVPSEEEVQGTGALQSVCMYIHVHVVM